MKLYEFEGHEVFSKVGIKSPSFVVCRNIKQIKEARNNLKFPIVAKVQVLSGKRGKSGGVKVCTTEKQLVSFAEENFGQEFMPTGRQGSGEKVVYIGLFEKVEIEKEHYISITYDTVLKVPFLLYSEQGGVDIEEVQKTDPEAVLRVDIDPVEGVKVADLKKKGVVSAEFAQLLWEAFSKYDCRLCEVNPLAATKDGEFVAVDSKVILDDSGLLRHDDLNVIPKGAAGAVPTKRELLAKKIDAEDYRGSSGSTFIELPGDIAILASGGGASLLVMDSLALAGGEAANYTEYSGNPPKEKVEALTKIALDKEGLSGCLVSGAVANFTDIYETLSGFLDGLKKVKPKAEYPVVIRRGGPRQEEAYKMLEVAVKEEGFDIHLFGPETPISVASQKMVELSNQFKSKKVEGKS